MSTQIETAEVEEDDIVILSHDERNSPPPKKAKKEEAVMGLKRKKRLKRIQQKGNIQNLTREELFINQSPPLLIYPGQ